MAVEGDTVYVLMQDAERDGSWIVLGVYASQGSADKVIDLLHRADVRGSLKIEPQELRA